jgi:hypothetical protein
VKRTWNGVQRSIAGGTSWTKSPLPRHATAPSTVPSSDPNNDIDRAAILEWLQYSDFYQFPHVQIFSTISELIDILTEALNFGVITNLTEISLSMRRYNDEQKQNIEHSWGLILENIHSARTSKQSAKTYLEDTDTALHENYGVRLKHEQCIGSE